MFIEVKGENYNLKYDFNAICAIEAKSGKGLFELMQDKSEFTATRVMLWGGLLKHDKNITLDAVGDIMQDFFDDGKQLIDIVQHIFNALTEAGIFKKQEETKSDVNVETENEETGK